MIIRTIFGAAMLAITASAAIAEPKWGCGAVDTPHNNIGNFGDTWDYDSEAEAKSEALKECGAKCRIVSCRPDVATQQQADAIWFPAGAAWADR